MTFSPKEQTEFNSIRPVLMPFCMLLTNKNREDAKDLCQDTLLGAWRAQDNFQSGTNLKAWIFMIARNQRYSDLRRDWRKTDVGGDHNLSLMIEGDFLQAADPLARLELEQTLEHLSKLSPVQQEAIWGRVGNMSYEEIAEMQGVSSGTVKSRVSRARTSLEDSLQRSEIQHPQFK